MNSPRTPIVGDLSRTAPTKRLTDASNEESPAVPFSNDVCAPIDRTVTGTRTRSMTSVMMSSCFMKSGRNELAIGSTRWSYSAETASGSVRLKPRPCETTSVSGRDSIRWDE